MPDKNNTKMDNKNKDQQLFEIGKMVKYQMRYNSQTKFWDALVVDNNPITLRIKFPDGYVHETEPDEEQTLTRVKF